MAPPQVASAQVAGWRPALPSVALALVARTWVALLRLKVRRQHKGRPAVAGRGGR
jgi:hypothetical protein